MKTFELCNEKLAEIRVSYSHPVPASERIKVNSSKDAVESLREIYKDVMEHHERFEIILMNRANQILGFYKIGEGGINGTVADTKMIFQVALKTNSSAIILSHNHPSGNRRPSEADIAITKKVTEAGKFLDIAVLDHIIITNEEYYSFADEGIM